MAPKNPKVFTFNKRSCHFYVITLNHKTSSLNRNEKYVGQTTITMINHFKVHISD